MHGGRGGEDRKRRRRHMWPVPPAPAASNADSLQAAPDCFVKDGRKIRVGDCALFQAGNAPPFIGIIRWFTRSKDNYLKLCVNWLYRPADVKLAKGISLDAAPNEVFYSFHKDVIAAASLLHPCKVAFLRKGVDIPGVCSFVCRRVYDIENKCLWWLTDQDYINERQEEVDHLLEKTRLEMHAALQSGGRSSPKPLNGPGSTQQLKSGSDSVQNSGTSFPSQVKGKKRDRGDQTIEPSKRERATKAEDGDSISFRLEGMIKAEIAKITDKGGLTNYEGVDKLVHLMQLDRSERKIDLAGRVLLADVIAATERNDCLSRFVELSGVPVLDEWLQEAHKGKSGDGTSPKESDKSVEELLLALLRALDRLPVSLNALQTCNIGKSVNHLRTHKNFEIQKKARSLVDTWKKRVDAEIKNHDAKSFGSNQAVPWPGKPGFSEVSHVLNRRTGSGDATMKGSVAQPSICRPLPGKPGHADAIVKSTPATTGSLKLPSSLPASKDSPQTAPKEEKSSSSSQSQNNSQSCSSDHAKTMGSSWKEDARSSTAGSVNGSKTSSGSSRHRRSSNGFQKETNLVKSGSLIRTSPFDKVAPQGAASVCERPVDVPISDQGGSSHRLIVRLPNPGRSPVQSAGGTSFEDTSVIGSRASSPSTLDKHEINDRKIKARGDRSYIATDGNAESWQNNDSKGGLTGCDESDRSQAATLDDERRSADQTEKTTDLSRATCSSSGIEKGRFLIDPRPRNSFSSMNALIESCVKYSEDSAPIAAGDAIGINLLATVADELPKSNPASPTGSPGSSPTIENPCAEVKSRLTCDVGIAQSHGQSHENADVDPEMHGKSAGSAIDRDEQQETGIDFSGDKKIIGPLQENKAEDSCMKSEVKLEDERADTSFSTCIPTIVKEEVKCDSAFQDQDKVTDCPSERELKSRTLPIDEHKSLESSCEKVSVGENTAEGNMSTSDSICSPLVGRKSEKLTVAEPLSCLPFIKEVPIGATSTEQQLTPAAERNHPENVDTRGDDADPSSFPAKVLCSESSDSKTRNLDGSLVTHLEPIDTEKKEPSIGNPSSIDQCAGPVPPVAVPDGVEEIVEKTEIPENHESSPTHLAQEAERCTKSAGSRSSGADADIRDELTSSPEASSLAVAAHSDAGGKLDFDLNEGIPGDDGNQSEPTTSPVLVCPPAVHLPCLSPFSSSPKSNGSPAPITVAAPAKGPFVHPENLSKKVEPGWKGSAATSAFRPAEPRKVLEMPLASSDVQSSASAGKHARPLLDIDLNVADERVLEELPSQSSAQTVRSHDAPARSSGGGLDLDLNIVGEGAESGQFLVSTVRSAGGDANMLRDFDLNNGPGLDEVGVESLPRSQHAKSKASVPFLPPVAGLRMNTPEFGGVSSWFPPGNSYPAVAIPSFLPERGDQTYPIVAAAAGPHQRILGGTFGSDIYRGGPVLSSSPAVAFSPATAFPYAGFPFGSSFPVASTSFSGVSTSYVDSSPGGGSFFPAGAVSSHYSRPYVLSLPEGSTSGGSDSSRRWTRQGLDLNAGPGSAVDVEVKDDRLSSASRQLPVASSQAFAEDQARLYQVGTGGVKRKEPEGSWDPDKFVGYKQHSWQ